MEDHPLNLAHQQHRRAEAHLKCRRFDEAVQCHHSAAELLLDAMKSTTNSSALESISLQHSYHLKQTDLIKIKKEQYERVKKTLDNLKELGKEISPDLLGNENSKIQIAIYKTINETDSLLSKLIVNGNESIMDKPPSVFASSPGDAPSGIVLEKNQQTVIEELKILNSNLHSLVEQLVTQVEVLKDENMTLNERVNYLENERTKYLNMKITDYDSDETSRNSLQSTTVAGQSNRVASRPVQQLHFDLSAFKDD